MLTFGKIIPEQLGFVRIIRVSDHLDTDMEHQTVVSAGHILAELQVPTVRRIQCDLLVRGQSEMDLRLNLERVHRWLCESGEARLTLRQLPGQYYIARCTEITAPVFNGYSARVTITFTCRDYRPYNLYNHLPAAGTGPETDGFTFAGRHVLRDMGCLFMLERKTGVPTLTPYKLSVPGIPGTVRYDAQMEPEEKTVTGTLYFLRGQASRTGLMSLPESEHRLRAMATWLLGSGRSSLVWDAQPDLIWEAEVDSAEYDRSGWQNGRLRLQMTIQPVARGPSATREYRLMCPADTSVAFSLEPVFPDGMGFETPVNLCIQNTGGNTVSDLTVFYPDKVTGQKAIRFSDCDFALTPGDRLSLNSEQKWAQLNDLDANRYISEGDFPSVPVSQYLLGIQTNAATSLTVTATVEPRWI